MKKILLIGYGKMGSSIVNGWTKKKINFKIFVIEKEEIKSDLKNNKKIYFLKTFEDFRKLNLIPDLIFVAVKPQQLPEIKNDLNVISEVNEDTNQTGFAKLVIDNSKIFSLLSKTDKILFGIPFLRFLAWSILIEGKKI